MNIRALTLVVLLLGGVGVCGAGSGWDPSGTPLPDGASAATLSLLRVLGAFAIVLALFFGGVYCFRNWERLARRGRAASKLSICEFRSLGHRHTLFVIGYDSHRMLVATSPSGVSLLTALPPAGCEVEEQMESLARPRGTLASFSDLASLKG